MNKVLLFGTAGLIHEIRMSYEESRRLLEKWRLPRADTCGTTFIVNFSVGSGRIRGNIYIDLSAITIIEVTEAGF